MKSKWIFSLLMSVIVANIGILNAGQIKLVHAFETYNAGKILSTDPAGIVYHPPSGNLFISDSEIEEIVYWNCENIFKVDLDGKYVSSTFDSYVNGGLSCDELLAAVHVDGTPWTDAERAYRRIRDREPTGITFNEFDRNFYITNDDRTRILQYDEGFGEAIAAKFVQNTDLEGITSDSSTGYLYVVVGQTVAGKPEAVPPIPEKPGSRVLVYNSNLDSLTEFSVIDRVTDPEGIAYDKKSNHLFLVSHADLKIFEYTLSGEFVTYYDISHLIPRPIDPQGLTFAPSSNPNDNPDNFNLYIVDGQVDNRIDSLEHDGIVYEVEILPIDFLANTLFKADKIGNSVGNVHSNNKIEFKKGLKSSRRQHQNSNNSVFTGNLTAVSDITIEANNTINGNVAAGGVLVVKSRATVNGTETSHSAVASVQLPVVEFSAGGTDINLRRNGNRSLNPGSYGKVKAKTRSKLILRSGQYFFESMDLGQNVLLEVDVSLGDVTINVVNKVKFGKNTRLSIIPSGENGSRNVTLRQAMAKDISFDNAATFWGSIIAPRGKVKLGKNVEFKGSIIADKIEVEENANLNTHSVDNSLTKMSGPQNGYLTNSKTNDDTTFSISTGFNLSQNYPDPFNPATRINFNLPKSTHVNMKIYNIQGQEILNLLNGTYEAGTHTVRWNGKNNQGNVVPSGIYFYQIQAGEFFQVKKMNLIK